MTSSLARKPAFWIAILVASALCMFAVLHWFGDAFPVLDLDVRMSRSMAIDDAKRIAAERHLTAVDLTQSAASFDGNAAAQTFIELEGGGKPALKPFIGGASGQPSVGGASGTPVIAAASGFDDEFALYRWRVRLFSPGVEREVQVGFTPGGRPVGFFSKVPEAEPGAALSEDEARTIATTTASRDWNVDFARYRPLTASAQTQPGKRVDHEFIYERRLDGAPSIGDGRLRLRLVVAGDRLVQLQRFIYVPEAFARRYETMRSANNNIAAAASIVAGLVYGLGGCLVGLIWLMRRHAVRWAPSSKWAAVVALFITAAALSAVAGSWIGYDTATSAATHRITGIAGALVGGVVTWLLLTVVFATAEGLGRLAFGTHPQLWRAWLAPAGQSRAIWGRTLAGYAWIGFDLAFIATFYFVVQRYLGWWSPSDSLVDPNILGRPLPWLAPVSMALQAGMMEESLFRAVPLAGAALLGRRFGHEKAFIVVALVLQAIVFGCAHANYPGQPAYARPIELFVPSLVWGLVYLRYGLLPGMLFHFGFDLVLMSVPLFVTDAPGIVVDRAMMIGILAVPLIVLAVRTLRARRLVDLPDSERNAAAIEEAPGTRAAEDAVLEAVDDPAASTSTSTSTTTSLEPYTSRRDVLPWLVLGAIGLVGLGLRLSMPLDTPPLAIDRAQALAIAEHALADRGVTLDARWRRSLKAVAASDPSGARFAWREGGAALYARLIGQWLPPPHWEVRFARFDGDVAEREAWRVVVVDGLPAPDGVRLIEHDIPESRPGKRLAEADARVIADAAIADWVKLQPRELRAVSSHAAERPSRVDWTFVYANPAVTLPAGGEARIVAALDGDEVVVVGRSLFVPDAWERAERQRDAELRLPRIGLGIVGLAFLIAFVVSLVRRLARGEASKRGAAVAAIAMAISVSAGVWLDLGATQFGFTVAEPFDAQMLRVVLQWAGVASAAALFAALVAAVGVRIARRDDAAAARQTMPVLRRWIAPLALALLIAGDAGYARLFGPASSPLVPVVGSADAYSPALVAFLGQITFPVTVSVLLIALAILAPRRRAIEIVVAIGIVVSAMLARASTADPTALSIVGFGLLGVVAWLVYRLLIRDRPWIVAPTILCLALVRLLPSLVEPAFPGARLADLVAIVGAIVGYRLWCWVVRADVGRGALRAPRATSPRADAN